MRFVVVLAGLLMLAFVAVPLWWLMIGALHWALFGLAVWLAFSLLRGPRRRYLRPPAPYRLPPWRGSLPGSPPWTRPPAHEPPPAVWRGLPFDAMVTAERIREKARALLRRQQRFALASKELYTVRATLDDYLPRTVDAYLAVPPQAREKPLRGAKTPAQELREQLALLERTLDEIAADLRRREMDGLLANRRFLEERFGRAPLS